MTIIVSVDQGEDVLAKVECAAIEQVLADTNGNIAEAARRLGVLRQVLQRKMTRHGLRGQDIT